jgi:hypothetical protein
MLCRAENLSSSVLQFVHSGLVGDYIAWMVAGLAVLILALQHR